MPSSSSEDDFMSDKYLQAAETTSRSSAGTKTYAQRRQEAQKRHLAAQPKSRKVREEEARRQALETSLFDLHTREGVASESASGNGAGARTPTTTGAGKAMGMMMKMGWKVGEGLGKKLDDPPSSSNTPKAGTSTATSKQSDSDDDTPNPGIGSNKKRKLSPSLHAPSATTTTTTATAGDATTSTHRATKPRIEPIRISMWAGKLGLGAHQRSPSPEDMSFLLGQAKNGHGTLSTSQMKKLDSDADEFRRRRAGKEEGKRVEGMQWKARALLKEFDEAKGMKFHPLWTIPSAPETTIPRPLLRLIDPSTAEALDTLDDGHPPPASEAQEARIHGRTDEENMDEASRLREQMRRDALVELDNVEEDGRSPAFANGVMSGKSQSSVSEEADPDAEQIDWASFVPGVQRVLSMSPSTHLTYLVSSLRADHLYCFWCAARYGTVEEMDGPGGCPGEEEDDH